jgi:hypothetical protein
MTNFEFSANGMVFGTYSGETKEAAQEVFAVDSGYESWAAMVEQAEENGGNNVEVVELD